MFSYNSMVRSAPDNFQVCSPVTARPGGAVEEGAVVRHAGGGERRTGPGEEEGGGKEERAEAGRGIRLVTLLPRPRKVIQV